MKIEEDGSYVITLPGDGDWKARACGRVSVRSD